MKKRVCPIFWCRDADVNDNTCQHYLIHTEQVQCEKRCDYAREVLGIDDVYCIKGEE